MPTNATTSESKFVPQPKVRAENRDNREEVGPEKDDGIDEAKTNAKTVNETPKAARVEVAPAMPVGGDPNAVRNAELTLDVSEAEAQQQQLLDDLLRRDAQRQKAPEGVTVFRPYVNKRAIKVALWRERGLIADNEGEFFDSKENHARNISLGYIPIIDRGRHQGDGSDLAYKRDRRITELEQREARLRAREMLAGVGKDMAEADPTREVMTENTTAYSPEEWERG